MKKFFAFILILSLFCSLAYATCSCPAGAVCLCSSGASSGDMLKSDYDTDSDNKVDVAEALAANGANCSSGQAPLGVDASGASEGCFAVEPSISAGTSGQYYRGDKSWQALNTSAINWADLTSLKTALGDDFHNIGGSENDPTVNTSSKITTIIGAQGLSSSRINWDDVASSTLQTRIGSGVYQASDATLTALAALDSVVGFLKQTAADTFTKIALLVSSDINWETVVLSKSRINWPDAFLDCQDTGGNHVNYNAGTNTFSCGTSGGASGVTSVTATQPITSTEGTTPDIGLNFSSLNAIGKLMRGATNWTDISALIGSAPSGQYMTGINTSGAGVFSAPKQHGKFCASDFTSRTSSVYYGINGSAATNSANEIGALQSFEITISNLEASILNTDGSGCTWTAVLRENEADSALTCTLPTANPSSCSDTAHSVVIEAGNRANWKLTKGGTCGGSGAFSVCGDWVEN